MAAEESLDVEAGAEVVSVIDAIDADALSVADELEAASELVEGEATGEESDVTVVVEVESEPGATVLVKMAVWVVDIVATVSKTVLVTGDRVVPDEIHEVTVEVRNESVVEESMENDQPSEDDVAAEVGEL